MAENHYFIFVTNQPSPDVAQLLPKLGLEEYEPVGEVDIRDTNKPETLYVGHYNGCLIFAHPSMPFEFFGDDATETEKRFIACFPNAEIATLIENTTVDLFGFSIIQNGRKVRMKDGSDNKFSTDFGEPVEEEKENRWQDQFDEEEIESLREDGMDEEEVEEYIKFQNAWGMPNRISKRYLGECFGAIEPGKVKMTKYRPRNKDH
jgi:hydroxymethylpyrimidine pyrophosphatase-like HAD family hydrolase